MMQAGATSRAVGDLSVLRIGSLPTAVNEIEGLQPMGKGAFPKRFSLSYLGPKQEARQSPIF
jgi:hypothetical protein